MGVLGPSTRNVLAVLCLVLLFNGAAVRIEAEEVVVCLKLMDVSPHLEPFVDELTQPTQVDISTGSQITISAYKIKQKLHRDLPATTLYAYGTSEETAAVPGPTLVATRGIPSVVRWENKIHDRHHFLHDDDSFFRARPANGGIALVTHLHGAEVPSESDGHPGAWYTASGDTGPTYTTNNYTYTNSQSPTLLWYHDHTVGIGHLNVAAGLSGAYIIRSSEEPQTLPRGEFEKFLILQDKTFHHNGAINFPDGRETPRRHSVWCPEYFGDTILVNGKAWPYLNVYPTKYRFRLLNGANARFFILSLGDTPGMNFTQIGSDQGYLQTPVTRASLTLGPAERVDLIIDFSKIKPGNSVVLNNRAKTPFPDGVNFSPPQARVVMKFNVVAAPDTIALQEVDIPKTLAPEVNIDTKNARRRKMVMTETEDSDLQPMATFLNGVTFEDPATEFPELGSTEIWEIINLTDDGHPIHIHLVSFRVKSQQAFDTEGYLAGNCTLDEEFGVPESCFTDEPREPLDDARGWKDTVVVYPGKVTEFVIRWTTREGEPFSFDASVGPGYVWHCHILEHEDNDMMRPLKLVKPSRGVV